MTTIHSVQFCDTTQNLDITGSPSRELDADEVRVWTADSELIVAVSYRGEYGGDEWQISGSDHIVSWTEHADYFSWNTWRDAVEFALILLGIPLAELDAVL
jgi:hypothetical protein